MAIRPDILLQQVQGTAMWAFEDKDAGYIRALGFQPKEGDTHWEHAPAYFNMLLAAHFTTVATYVPTDVDNRIRFHQWQAANTQEQLDELMVMVDASRLWPVRKVTECVVDCDGEYIVGHDGEFLSVDSGALGRAIELKHEELVQKLTARIEDDLMRSARVFTSLSRRRGAETQAMCAAFVLAHTAGDLTRVVDDWPVKTEQAELLRARFSKPEESKEAWGAAFRLAGKVNREVMAKESHRFLPLREAKALRRSRSFLRCFGPWLEPVGETIAQSKLLSDKDRAEALTALLHGVEQTPESESYVRAIVGLNRKLKGGIDSLESELPARLRKTLRKGAWRRELDVDDARFRLRMIAKWTRATKG